MSKRLLDALRIRARDERGQTLIETALTMLVLIGLIFAVIETSMAVYSFHYLGSAAHEAARYAIVRGGDWGVSCSNYGSSQCTASANDIRNFVAYRGFPGIQITPGDVYVSYFGTMQNSVSRTCSDGSDTTDNFTGDTVQVTICYPFSFALPGIGSYTYNLTSTSQMVIAQ